MSRATKKLNRLAGASMPPDYPLFVLMLLILSLGLFLVFDASYARASQPGMTHGDAAYFFKQQARWAIVGLMALLGAMRFQYWKLSRYGVHAVGLALVLLCLVWIPHLGVRSHGAARWVHLGPVQLQPSEVAKICMVLFLASYISRRPRSIKQFQGGLMGALIPIGVVAGLIIKEPDLGTALTLVSTCLVMLAVGGARLKHLGAVAGLGFCMVAALAMSHSYSRQRLLSFVAGKDADRTYAYQVTQSVEAIEAGGIHGRGPGGGDAKFFHLPACYTDFIATTAGEEFGLVGSLGLIGLFFGFSLRGFHIAHRCPNAFGCLMGTGLCTVISLQSLLNLAVVTRTVPDTGVPLPMMSFGGSSLVLVMFSTGLLLSISRWPEARYVDVVDERPVEKAKPGSANAGTAIVAGGDRYGAGSSGASRSEMDSEWQRSLA